MRTRGAWALLVMAAFVVATAGPVYAQGGQSNEQKLSLTGINYTKWLWGNLRYDGSLYNFTTVPGEGYGDNGQGTEFEILVASKPSQWIEVSGRLKARFNQNFWTNFGGFGGRNPAFEDNPSDCIGGDCGEFDPRSAQYVKFRGLTVRLIPGYEWVDVVTIGSSDWGMFDPFTIGKIRYIDRDNGSGLLFQGGTNDRKLTYDFARISLPRLWAGPNFNTGEFAGQDAAYQALFERYGVQRVEDMDELATALIMFAQPHQPAAGGLVSIHDSGGERQLIIDLADRVEAATARELAEQERLRRTDDFREGTRAMAERRRPEFTGIE